MLPTQSQSHIENSTLSQCSYTEKSLAVVTAISLLAGCIILSLSAYDYLPNSIGNGIARGLFALAVVIPLAVCCCKSSRKPLSKRSESVIELTVFSQPTSIKESMAIQSSSCLAPSNAFQIHLKKEAPQSVLRKELKMTTFNVGMLPTWINKAQTVGKYFTSFFSTDQTKLLGSPTQRAPLIAKKLATLDQDILCGQELFSPDSSSIVQKALESDYNIIHSIGSGKPVNSGLFFATRDAIVTEGVKFWSFTNLGGEDALSVKGVLRVPVIVQAEEKPVIFYTTHLQAKIGQHYADIRRDEALGILELIVQDQSANPECPIFLLGDLNITDDEPGSSVQEYTNLQVPFFSHFHDFHFVDHDVNGLRTKGSACFLEKDLGTTNVNHEEPKGSFYDMTQLGTGIEISKLRYDFCLLYKGNKNVESLESHSELRRFMQPDLSDHLPLTTVLNLKQLLALYKQPGGSF